MEGSRPAVAEDVPRLAELAATAVEELRQGRGGEVWARTQGRRAPFTSLLEAEVASPVHLVVAGTIDEVILGYGVARIDDLVDGSRLGTVSDLYVEPGARGVGIGEAMMDDLVAFCSAAGCNGVDSLALPGDRHTKNFFEGFGLVARAIVVHRALP